MSATQIDRILAGSLELFLKAGLKSVTMDDIARHLGMSKKTIYQFFKDKSDLITALVTKRLKEDEAQMCSLIEQGSDVIEQLIDMMKCSEEVFSRINPVVIHDLQKYYPEGWKAFQKFKSETITHTIEQLLIKGIEQGYIRPDIDPKIIAKMRVIQVESGFDTQLFPSAQFNTWKVQTQFLEAFTYGICTLKGYKLLNKHKNINEE